VPVAAEDVAESVNIDWLPEETVLGLKDAVTPEGRFATLRAML
jgi:hypothetical protein